MQASLAEPEAGAPTLVLFITSGPSTAPTRAEQASNVKLSGTPSAACGSPRLVRLLPPCQQRSKSPQAANESFESPGQLPAPCCPPDLKPTRQRSTAPA